MWRKKNKKKNTLVQIAMDFLASNILSWEHTLRKKKVEKLHLQQHLLYFSSSNRCKGCVHKADLFV